MNWHLELEARQIRAWLFRYCCLLSVSGLAGGGGCLSGATNVRLSLSALLT